MAWNRALIRQNNGGGEVYREDQWSAFTVNHLQWHYAANPDGDGYALTEDAPADAIANDFDIRSETQGAITLLIATLNRDRYNARINALEN